MTHYQSIVAELERLRGLAAEGPVMLAYCSGNERLWYADAPFSAWLGRATEEVIGHPIADVLGEAYEPVRSSLKAALAGEEQRFELRLPASGDRPARYGRVQCVPDVGDGEVRGMYVLVTDSATREETEANDAERQAMATERLTAIATLTQGIAHEINNPLAIALLGIDDALDQLDSGDADPVALRESISSAREGMSRMVGIVQSMKLLARLDTTDRERVDIKSALEESIALTTTELRYRARLASEIADVGVIDGNSAQLSQVFVSLLMSIAKALPENHSERNEVLVTARRDGAAIVVEISDNGSGRPEEGQRAFERFFTMGGASGEIGLGLSVTRDVVAALGGSTDVERTASGGTLFRVTLPAAPEQLHLPGGVEQPPSRAVRSSSHRGLGRRGRILVVDDEPLVGRSLKRHLAPKYDIESVTRGRDAIDRALNENYDVILCDLMMPDVSGPEVYDVVTASRPDLAERFIFMTGGAFTPRGRQFLGAVTAPVLSKPFDLSVLDATVRRIALRTALSAPVRAVRRPGSRD